MKKFIMDTSYAPINWEPKTIEERIAQNAKNLLMLRMGEVPYDRRRGLNRDVEHKPLKYVQDNITLEIGRVLGFEPDARVIRAEANHTPEGLRIVCEVEVDENPTGRQRFRL